MTARKRLARSSLFAFILLAIGSGTTPAAAAPATIIDSFTDPLPVNPLLPASGARVLFLGALCDGAACPPGSVVPGPEFVDQVEQGGLPGILGPLRKIVFATYFEPNPGASGVLTIDPSGGGSLAWSGTVNPGLAVGLNYGDESQHLNYDLRADGSDRFEIEILSAPVSPWGVGQLHLQLHPKNAGSIGAPSAVEAIVIYGPGLLVIPYADLGDRLDEFEHDIAFMTFDFPGSEFVIGEIRTASAPTPSEPTSWGRIKGAYRR